ncbi:porin [Candidatus Pelagibacter ubique]|nr:porin [Candidatus Pelagibacter ubique]
MNNFKKIGMTALAASLVSTSVFAGELAVSGSASINWENYSGKEQSSTKSFSMGNQITFSGSGELDNGMTVGVSFTIDEFDGDTTTTTGPADGSIFDAHSVTVSSDALGTLVFHGEGGDSAQNAVGDTAAGNIWDNFDSAATVLKESGMSTNSMHYTLPSIIDGVSLSASYSPNKGQDEADTAMALVYTGVEGLTVSLGKGSSDGDAAATANLSDANADTTSMKVSYAYGPVTVAYSDHEHDASKADGTNDQDATSFKLSYTVSDALSLSYAEEEIDSKASSTNVDAEYSKVVASYTSGGMTVSANYQEADNIDFSTSDTQDKEYYGLSLSFAF